MQFFAYKQQQIIHSEDAEKGVDYRCPECQGRLRIKGGLHRRKHFFHLSPPPFCSLSKKTETHLTIQKAILERLPPKEALLEKWFPSIRRIADVVWEPQKLIFEVQCSPISLQEVKERMEDYASVGYRVIWLLHDHRFNRKRLSAAEHHLRPLYAFFTTSKGFFYDQYEVFSGHLRTEKGPSHPISLTHLPTKTLPPPQKKKHPSIKNWGRFFYYFILKKLS